MIKRLGMERAFSFRVAKSFLLVALSPPSLELVIVNLLIRSRFSWFTVRNISVHCWGPTFGMEDVGPRLRERHDDYLLPILSAQ
ncbi:hypothetical protein PILCRDRAFT_555817 [Piloderma croceum F 1598]|uniref:Uncharacterized protein n=1 Tax=Piloderma croceum (strain F 1598) TaxID=765440 RepID=A0A0C3AZH6_PILCF|nr:hypothetical protein PILCRDRAFT_555817 [Piloderma croceum F 1598]